jgi:hypothetical protein
VTRLSSPASLAFRFMSSLMPLTFFTSFITDQAVTIFRNAANHGRHKLHPLLQARPALCILQVHSILLHRMSADGLASPQAVLQEVLLILSSPRFRLEARPILPSRLESPRIDLGQLRRTECRTSTSYLVVYEARRTIFRKMANLAQHLPFHPT